MRFPGMQDMDQMTDQLTSDFDRIVQRGRDGADHILGVLADSARSTSRSQRVAAGIVLASIALGVGALMYRQRRRKPMTARLRDYVPGAMGAIRDLPDEIRTLARKAAR